MKHLRTPALIVLALLVSACGNNVDMNEPIDQSAPEILSFTANPTTVVSGGSSRLTWEVEGTIELLEVTTEHFYSPKVVTNENAFIARPTETTTYVLRARNPAGSDEEQVVVEVTDAAE